MKSFPCLNLLLANKTFRKLSPNSLQWLTRAYMIWCDFILYIPLSFTSHKPQWSSIFWNPQSLSLQDITLATPFPKVLFPELCLQVGPFLQFRFQYEYRQTGDSQCKAGIPSINLTSPCLEFPAWYPSQPGIFLLSYFYWSIWEQGLYCLAHYYIPSTYNSSWHTADNKYL